MNHLAKFYTLSAIYFGLASPVVVAQPVPAAGASSPAGTVEETVRDEFQHPMLEQRSGSQMQLDADEDKRIQRRGMSDTRKDGEMRRNVLPGAGDAGTGPLLDGDAPERRTPAERRNPN